MGSIKTNTNIRTSLTEVFDSLVLDDGTHLQNGYSNYYTEFSRQIFTSGYDNTTTGWKKPGSFIPFLFIYWAYPGRLQAINACKGFTFHVEVQRSYTDSTKLSSVDLSVNKAVVPTSIISGESYDVIRDSVALLSNQPIQCNLGNVIQMRISPNVTNDSDTKASLKYGMGLLPVE